MAAPRKTIREKLSELLAAEGYHVEPHRLTSAVGYWRITKAFDDTTVTWDASADSPRGSLHLVSYNTMTECVRRGIETSVDGHLVWVHAKGKPEAS